jgi:hypothetical protein
MFRQPATQRPMANLSRPMEATPRSEKRRDEPRYDYGLLILAGLRPSLKSGTAEAQSCLGRDVRDQAVLRRRQCLIRRRAWSRGHHARPGRGRHDDRARHCHCLSPTLGWDADVREAEPGMISRDGDRHCEVRAICSKTRVTLLAISPTMIAPIGPECCDRWQPQR